MLSRVAERLYWLGRYVERAENTARLVSVNAQLLLDMPSPATVLWRSLIEILGCQADFAAQHPAASERSVMRYVVADEASPASLVSALRGARENARTVREVLPSAAWELVNHQYWSAHERAEQALARKHRQEFLDSIILQCQQFAGLLANTMSHREPYHFVTLGGAIERADMTSRILDIGCIYAQGRHGEVLAAHENVLWMNVLLSLSAYQMYRQQVRERVNGRDVVAFLLQDPAFPHAIACCLDAVEHALGQLPRNRGPLRVNREIVQQLRRADPDALLAGGLHDYLDSVQREVGRLHAAIETTWFANAV
jgi:uncharacterized alpha-E superfamily protein